MKITHYKTNIRNEKIRRFAHDFALIFSIMGFTFTLALIISNL